MRLNAAGGDGRHVAVSASDTFSIYDTGLEAVAHGDHFHYYEQTPPHLTDLSFDAPPSPGHVVAEDGRTAFFADGTGAITIIDPAALGEGELDVVEETSADDPHHGVAVPLSDGGLLLTQGTEESRSTVQVLDADGTLVAETDDCPGVHGEAVAQPTESGDVISLGCENGPVVYRDGEFHKVAVDTDYQRSGNQKGSADSPIVLADNKVEADPRGRDGAPPHVDRSHRHPGRLDDHRRPRFPPLLVPLPGPRPDGEALVLTGDGELNILDPPESGEMLHEVQVMDEWTEPEQWQTAGPMLAVADGTAFVVDPTRRSSAWSTSPAARSTASWTWTSCPTRSR